MERILLVEDDMTFGIMLKTWMTKRGFDVDHVSSVSEAQRRLSSFSYDFVLSDLRLPDEDGVVLLKWMKNYSIKAPLIMMTSYAEVQTAVLSMKLGAADFIAKPINPEDLLKKIEALRGKEEVENQRVEIMGSSEVVCKLRDMVRLVAPTSMSVIVRGEMGVGKKFLSKHIHKLSKRGDKPLVLFDCATFRKKTIVSDELLSAVSGATLLFAGVDELSAEHQSQLSRAIHSNVFVDNDIRLISTFEGEIDSMLLMCLNEFSIDIPPLRERKEDIVMLSNSFIDEANDEFGKSVIGFGDGVDLLLSKYDWPGNIWELKSVVRKSVLLADGDFIECCNLPPEMSDSNEAFKSSLKNKELEKEMIIKALRDCNYNKSQAAHLLRIDRKTLYNKIKQYEI